MSKSKASTPADYHLFPVVYQAATDHNPQFREDFFQALRQDMPDLDAIFQAQENSAAPDDDYLRIRALLGRVLSRGGRQNDTELADYIQSLYRHLPRPVISDFPILQNQHLRGGEPTPLVMVLDNEQFQASMEEGNPETIALLVADFLVVASTLGRSIQFAEPALGARMEQLLDQCDPNRVAVHFVCADQGRKLDSATLAKMGERQEAWARRLSKMLTEAIEPHAKALLEANHKAGQTSKTGKAKKSEPVLLPASGATVMLIEARQELEKLLGDKTVQGAWLNQAKVHSAVRNTSLQAPFIEACERAGAFKQDKPRKEVAAKKKINTGNKLLGGLTLEGVEAPSMADNIKQAKAAVEGYMASIEDARDLSAVVLALRTHGAAQRTAWRMMAKTIAATAARIGYSPLDAYAMMSNEGWSQDPTAKDNLELLNVLDNGRWTAGEIDAAFANRPGLSGARHLVGLLRVVVDRDSKAWEQVSDATICKMAMGWANSGVAKDTWSDARGHLKPFQARLVALDQDAKARVFSEYVSYQWSRDNDIGRDTTKQLTGAIFNSIPEADTEAFIKQAHDVRSSNHFLYDMLHHIDGPFMQKELIQAVENGMRVHHQNGEHLTVLSRLLGYGSGFDKQLTLDSLSGDTARLAFSTLLAGLMQEDFGRQGNRFYSWERERDVQISSNLAKNMAFDLHELLTPLSQTPATLTWSCLLVDTGVAQKGDLLAWDGFCHLVAPFLEYPRPALDAMAGDGEKKTQSKQEKGVLGVLLDKSTLKSQLERGIHMAMSDDARDIFGYGRRDAKMMRGKSPLEMMAHGFGMAPRPGMLRSFIAQDALQHYRRGTWFETPKVEAEAKAGTPGGAQQERSRPGSATK